ncbi:MarR family transcriptional regulator [Fictibacillus sp. 5RED26]|jgi:MarR family transcriptional regulator, 2-MHQ and catechol-resistance regulon repressor|uniref:MarR family transcriptional regulator n=1 Tax=Fictibacillus TaxID=1329200 RepID=UPI0018CCA103|nr:MULTISPECIES: MarR family transcriptional regulator [unclassified Fictibacillus]MBH0155287.1 MarR family transcriptional regulator [Fictibacillus sp. 5RED26]MBH0164931.1 MarR family transcriptional regulator [Fictibacillus sp. 7GRE50]MBH0172472.1 MarR family transcriptional regulator [Fictibacillus sp. 23RED33]
MNNNNNFEIYELIKFVKNFKESFLHDEKLNYLQIETMIYLLENQNQTITALAKKIDTTPASTSTLIDRLAKKGMVDRQYTESDRRKVYVSLTENGSQEITRLLVKKNEIISSSLSPLTSEEKLSFTKLNELFKKIND